MKSYNEGNKAKGRILKRVLQVNKARQIYQKTIIFYPLIPPKCLFFGKFGVLCFPVTLVFEICLFAFLATNYRQLA